MSTTAERNIEDGENAARKKVDLDTILVEEIGQFGKYQLRTMLLCMIPMIFTAWASSEYVFTTARISTRCLIPECDGAEPEFSPTWVANAIPESTGGLDNCQRYGNTSQSPPPDSCPAELFDRTQLMPCQDYVYENTETIVYDFDMACSEWKRSMIGTIRTLATLLNMPMTGFISDRWGRKVALIINSLNTAWIGTLRYFANTLTGFIIFEFVETALGSEVTSSSFILILEITGPKYRMAAACTVNAVFSVGQVLIGLIAWAVPYWRALTLTLYLPMFICIAYIWLINESLRWLMSKGKYDQLEELLQKVAKTNGKTLSPASVRALRESHEEEKRVAELEKASERDAPWLVVLVFRHKGMVLRCLVTAMWWITIMLIFFGLTINSVNISGNKYMNYVAVAAVAIPGYLIAIYLMGIVGRKPVIVASFWLCAACMAVYVFLPAEYSNLSLVFYLLGKTSIASVATAVYVHAAEIFPTKHRHSLLAFASMMGRIGSITAPLTPALSVATFEKFPFVLFGSFALVSGFLTFLVPETLGTTLPDTMEEAAKLGTKQAEPSKSANRQ